MATQSKRDDIQRRIEVCEKYASLWEEYFRMFGFADFREKKKILPQEETQFQKIIRDLARQQFRFSFFMGDKFGDGDKIIDVLERSESLRVLQEMQEANFQKLEVDWHQIFINMHRAVGRLTRELPVEEPEGEQEESGKGKKGKKGAKTAPKRAPSAPRAAPPTSPGAPKRPPGPPRPKGP